MNHRIKFLELVLSDLISERDTLEIDLNFILNNNEKRTKNRKKDFKKVLGEIVYVNNKIKTLSDYMSSLAPETEFKNEDVNSK